MAVGAMVFTGPVMATGYMSGNDRLGRRGRRGYADGGAAGRMRLPFDRALMVAPRQAQASCAAID